MRAAVTQANCVKGSEVMPTLYKIRRPKCVSCGAAGFVKKNQSNNDKMPRTVSMIMQCRTVNVKIIRGHNTTKQLDDTHGDCESGPGGARA
jgi:hypothetical protein